MITWNCYNYIVEITWNCYKYIVIITRNCDIVIMTKLWNIKLCNQRTLPTHRILQEDRSAFNCARFIEIRLVIHESLKVAVVAFKVPTSWKEHCKIITIVVCSYHGAVFLLTKLLQQVLTDISRLSRPTCSSASSTLSTQTRALWSVPVIWVSVAKIPSKLEVAPYALKMWTGWWMDGVGDTP